MEIWFIYLKEKKKKVWFFKHKYSIKKKKLFPNSCLDKLGVCCAIALWFYPWCTCSLQAAAACWACAGAVPLAGPQGRLARGATSAFAPWLGHGHGKEQTKWPASVWAFANISSRATTNCSCNLGRKIALQEAVCYLLNKCAAVQPAAGINSKMVNDCIKYFSTPSVSSCNNL